jgi:hypothetical protein
MTPEKMEANERSARRGTAIRPLDRVGDDYALMTGDSEKTAKAQKAVFVRLTLLGQDRSSNTWSLATRLHYGLNAPPTASQAFVPGAANAEATSSSTSRLRETVARLTQRFDANSDSI